MQDSKGKTTLRHRSFKEEKANVQRTLVGFGANLASFEIDDDGYQVVAKMEEPCFSVRSTCQALERINFSEFLIRSIRYTSSGADILIVPITQETMNNFVWSYIERYLSSYEEIEALSVAIGVLERVVDDLPRSVRRVYDDYTKMIIQ